MAVLFPIKINGFRFFVNPERITVKKRSQISQVRTLTGTTFQVWPDLPDEVKFEGLSFGTRALLELRELENAIRREPEQKEIEIVYKFNTYKGYIADLMIKNDAHKPRIFDYNLTFLSKQPWKLDDMPIGQTTGLKAEFDFIEAQIRGASETIANLPNDTANDLIAVSNSISRVGLNIGRGRFINRRSSGPG